MTTTTKETAVERDYAILVGVGGCLDELEALCETCNIETVGRITQNIKEIDPKYYIGSGKVEEVAVAVQENGATVVVFDVELSGSKVRNLEEAVRVPVLDRSKIILDIFAQRATSAEGQLQVELAQLKYNLPRIVGKGGVSRIEKDGGVYAVDSMAKMKTSVGMRGPGEKKLELDRRKIRDEILILEKRLEKLKSTRDLSRKSARQGGKPRVCLVGYTNSGKTTLLNTIAKAGAYAEDKLFATLDPKTAKVYIQDENYRGTEILLTDTVGFIDKLPHEFIKAFESTLDEVRYADLLLHIVDISNPNYEQQIIVVNAVLDRIGVKDIPVLLVCNKIDNASIDISGAVGISAKNNVNIDLLKQKILYMLKA